MMGESLSTTPSVTTKRSGPGSRLILGLLVAGRRHLLVIAAVLLAAIFVGNAWTPSNYSLALDRLGIGDQGPDWGTARPIRSDEWIVLTPYFQIAVNNQFERFNSSSPYNEDLRGVWALPLRDWALVFRPQMWAFFVVDPAYAYSFYFLVLTLSFLVGYGLLFRSLGIERRFAVVISLALFFSQFTQVWWSSNAGALALAPWPVVAFLSRRRWLVKLPLLAYTLAMWPLGQLYPPFMLAAGFAFAAMVLACRRDALRPGNLVVAAVSIVIATAVTLLYYADLFRVMQQTAYPGSRSMRGGVMAAEMVLPLLAQVLPYVSTIQFRPISGTPLLNECEVGVIGSFLPLLAAVFTDQRALLARVRRQWKAASVLSVALAMTIAWVMLPIPAQVGRILLWDQLAPPRMVLASGLLLTAIVGVLAFTVPWRITALRCLIFALPVLGSWWIVKAGRADGGLLDSWFDWVVLVPLAVLYSCRRRLTAASVPLALGLSAVLASVVTFGTFNPLQSAHSIFHPPETPQLRALREQAARDPNGWVAVEGHYGALLNGLGVAAVNHVLVAPQTEFFRKRFSDVPASRLSFTLNRYAHLNLTTEVDEPRLIQSDAVSLPIAAFGQPVSWQTDSDHPASARTAGVADRYGVVYREDGSARVNVSGKAQWLGLDPAATLQVTVGKGASVAEVTALGVFNYETALAAGDPATDLSRFALSVRYQRAPQPREADLQLISSHPRLGTGILPSILAVSVSTEPPPGDLARRGHVDSVRLGSDGRTVSLHGWVHLPASGTATQTVTVHTDLPVEQAVIRRVQREDVAAMLGSEYAMAGFEAVFTLREAIKSNIPPLCVSVWESGRGVLLHPAGGTSDCLAASGGVALR